MKYIIIILLSIFFVGMSLFDIFRYKVRFYYGSNLTGLLINTSVSFVWEEFALERGDKR